MPMSGVPPGPRGTQGDTVGLLYMPAHPAAPALLKDAAPVLRDVVTDAIRRVQRYLNDW
jgi:hypothetical protein